MTRSLATFALTLLAVVSSSTTVTAKQQKRALRGNAQQRFLQTYVPTLIDDPEDATAAPSTKIMAEAKATTSAPTEAATVEDVETAAPSDETKPLDVVDMEITQAPAEDEEAEEAGDEITEVKLDPQPETTEVEATKTLEEQKEDDPNVKTNDAGDGITFEIASTLDIKFFKGAGYLPDQEQEEVFFDMVRALYTNSIWESDLGNEFLRYETADIVGEFNENNEKLSYTWVSKVDMAKDTKENPRTVAYAMGQANFKDYITSLFAHNIAGIKHVDFKNVGTGYRL